MKPERTVEVLLLLTLTGVIAYFIAISEGFHGGGDSLAHFRLAKFSWEHPHYLLDHWGKPFFTLLITPFALLGFKATWVFNLFCGLLSSVLVMAISKHHKWRYAWVAIPVIFLTPIFLQEFFSCLTEAAFVTLLLMVLLLRIKNQFVAYFIVLSLLPFIRTEGVLFMFWFAAVDFLERRSWQLILLFSGGIIYSLVGWIAKGDILWLINEMPYVGGDHIYGSGKLLHYIEIMPQHIGWPVLIMTAISIAFLFLKMRNTSFEDSWIIKFVLAPTIIYIGFHSVIWYMGRVSLGLPRMLAVVVPLLALLIVYGLNELERRTSKPKLTAGLGVLATVAISFNAYQKIELPVPLSNEDKVIKEACEFIQSSELKDHKIHYYSLYSEMLLNLDPHNADQCQQIVHNRYNPHEEVVSGSLVLWDAHFAPNEGAMPLENLLENDQFEVVKRFEPEHPFNTLGNIPFEVYLFQRN